MPTENRRKIKKVHTNIPIYLTKYRNRYELISEKVIKVAIKLYQK